MKLINLATTFRTAQLLSHVYHNNIVGVTFLENHGFLGDLYDKFEGYYDDTVERIIGTGGTVDLIKLQNDAAYKLTSFPEVKTAEEIFAAILGLLRSINEQIEELSKPDNEEKLSVGTLNMIAGFADELEVVAYKVQQIIKK